MRIAILGSCVTRDAWASQHELDNVLFFGRTTLASLTSPAPSVDLSRLRLESPWQLRAVISDITKSILSSLEVFGPEVLIIDCINERYDIVRVGGTLHTRSDEFIRGGGEELDWNSEIEIVPRLSDDAQRLWANGAIRFANWVRQVLPKTRIIVHCAPWAPSFLAGTAADSPLRPFPRGRYAAPGMLVDPRPFAALTDRYHEALLRLLPAAECIKVDCQFHVGDPHHRWGPAPFHYIESYYEEFRRKAADLGIDLGITAPSSPGAEDGSSKIEYASSQR